jgi:protoporphyrin/coproporphyrin ferrochelatase
MESHHRNISGSFVANLGGEKKRKSWYDRPSYVESMAGLIKEQLDSFTDEELQKLFSAHGVPQSYIENGDPYQAQIEECVEVISKELPEGVKVHLR